MIYDMRHSLQIDEVQLIGVVDKKDLCIEYQTKRKEDQ